MIDGHASAAFVRACSGPGQRPSTRSEQFHARVVASSLRKEVRKARVWNTARARHQALGETQGRRMAWPDLSIAWPKDRGGGGGRGQSSPSSDNRPRHPLHRRGFENLGFSNLGRLTVEKVGRRELTTLGIVGETLVRVIEIIEEVSAAVRGGPLESTASENRKERDKVRKRLERYAAKLSKKSAKMSTDSPDLSKDASADSPLTPSGRACREKVGSRPWLS
jgi:hypothetical protein